MVAAPELVRSGARDSPSAHRLPYPGELLPYTLPHSEVSRSRLRLRRSDRLPELYLGVFFCGGYGRRAPRAGHIPVLPVVRLAAILRYGLRISNLVRQRRDPRR